MFLSFTNFFTPIKVNKLSLLNICVILNILSAVAIAWPPTGEECGLHSIQCVSQVIKIRTTIKLSQGSVKTSGERIPSKMGVAPLHKRRENAKYAIYFAMCTMYEFTNLSILTTWVIRSSHLKYGPVPPMQPRPTSDHLFTTMSAFK